MKSACIAVVRSLVACDSISVTQAIRIAMM